MKHWIEVILSRLRNWWPNADLVLLAGVLVIVGGTWIFIEVLDEVIEGEAQAVDEFILRVIARPDAPGWLTEIGRDLTALGGIAVLVLVTLAVAGYLAMRRKYHALMLLVVATLGGLLLSTALKHVIDRERPALVEHRSHVATQSFPSGHAMLSAVVYLTLGALLSRLVSGWKLKAYFIAIAMLLTFLVGVSRVFVGVHWPTDVLAGWSLGLAWAIACWIVARWLQRRGEVEAPD